MALTIPRYLDASVIVALFIEESLTKRARSAIVNQRLIVSDFAVTELSSAVARRVRMGEITAGDAATLFGNVDAWVGRGAVMERLEPTDLAYATLLVRRLELGLRAPDAVHLAIVTRLNATLVTLDAKLAGAAAALGMAVETGHDDAPSA